MIIGPSYLSGVSAFSSQEIVFSSLSASVSLLNDLNGAKRLNNWNHWNFVEWVGAWHCFS